MHIKKYLTCAQVERELNITAHIRRKLEHMGLLTRHGRSGYTEQPVEALKVARYSPPPFGETTVLICAMGVNDDHSTPSLFFDTNDPKNAARMTEIHYLASPEESNKISARQLYSTGDWSISQSNADFLVAHHCLVLASFAGFHLEGGRLVREITGKTTTSGRRAFLVEPLNEADRSLFLNTYLRYPQGPVNRIITPDDRGDTAIN